MNYTTPSLSIASPSLYSVPSSVSPTNNGFSWKNPWVIGGVIFILALFGINVFSILAKGTDEVSSVFHPIWNFFSRILKFFGFSTLTTVKQTATTSATGVSAIADTAAAGTVSAVDAIESKASNKNSEAVPSTGVPSTTTTSSQSALQTALNSASDAAAQNEGVEPDDSYSSIQGGGKAGWCYVGEQQGIRSCVQVGANDTCMSGDVFPTSDVCVNPNLRVG